MPEPLKNPHWGCQLPCCSGLKKGYWSCPNHRYSQTALSRDRWTGHVSFSTVPPLTTQHFNMHHLIFIFTSQTVNGRHSETGTNLFSCSCQGLPPSGKVTVSTSGSSNHSNSLGFSDTRHELAAWVAPTWDWETSMAPAESLHFLSLITKLNGTWKVCFLVHPGTQYVAPPWGLL